MLSVLIPTYNYNCQPLIDSINQQARRAGIEHEVIVLNDGSTTPMHFADCRQIDQPRNYGRARARNRLADAARYPYLLFIDSDSMPADEHYIERWLEHIPARGSVVLLGGRVYDEPRDPEHSLLPMYGRRERNTRTGKLNKPFTSPNFLIDRSTARAVRFDETLTGYGHEDTIYGIMLRRRGYDYAFVDNPVRHCHIESNSDFLAKTRLGLEQLHCLAGEYPELRRISKLLRWAEVTNLILAGPLARAIERGLLRHPGVALLQIYKLVYYKSL